MLSVLLGLGMSLHLLAYQATSNNFDQTLVANDYSKRCVTVQWTWKGTGEQSLVAGI